MPMINIRVKEVKTLLDVVNFFLLQDTKGKYIFDLKNTILSKAELKEVKIKIEAEYSKVVKKDVENYHKLMALLKDTKFEV